MRMALHGDVIAATLVLWTLPAGRQEAVLAAILEEADLADRVRKRLGRGHPVFGSGSLMEVARRRARPEEPFLDDREYLSCLLMVLGALWRHAVSKKQARLFPDEIERLSAIVLSRQTGPSHGQNETSCRKH